MRVGGPADAGEKRFSNSTARVALGALGLLLTVFCLIPIVAAQAWWVGHVFLPVTALLTFRGFRCLTVIVRPSTVLLRGYLRTQRIPLDTLKSARVWVAPVPLWEGGVREAENLVLYRRDGSYVDFPNFGKPPSREMTSWIRSAAQAINDSLGVST